MSNQLQATKISDLWYLVYLAGGDLTEFVEGKKKVREKKKKLKEVNKESVDGVKLNCNIIIDGKKKSRSSGIII